MKRRAAFAISTAALVSFWLVGAALGAPPKRPRPKPRPRIVDAGPPPEATAPADAGAPEASAASATTPDVGGVPSSTEAATDGGAPPPPATTAEAPTSPPPAAPSPDEAAEPDKASFTIGGRIFGYARVPIERPLTDPFQQVSSSVWIEGKATFNAATSAKLVLSADALTPSIEGTTELRGNIREAWASAHGHGLELRVGQQIIAWGNADGINVLDLLSATDFRFFTADAEVRKLGAFSTYFSWVPGESGPVEIDLVWTPVFPSSRLLFPLSLIPAGVTLAEPVHPKFALENSEVGGKVTFTGSGWDIAAIGYYGYNHLPEFYLAKEDATGIVIGQTNYHYAAAGGEASLTAGKWVFRLEGSYIFTESNRGTIAFIQPSYVGGVLGIERPLGERFRVNAQGVVRYYPYFTDPVDKAGPDPALQGIALANAIVQNYTDQLRPGATLRLAYTSEGESFEAEVFALYYFIGRDYLVRPVIGYRFSDAFKLQLGAEYFGGSEDRSIGSLHPFSGVFTQASFFF